jgi:hypothetical protein
VLGSKEPIQKGLRSLRRLEETALDEKKKIPDRNRNNSI